MNSRQLARQVLAALVLVMGFGGGAVAVEFHVSPEGDDGNSGTRGEPFLTLETARDAVRQAATEEGATIWLHEGRHFRKATFVLEAQDSGTPDKPVVYRAAE